MASASVLGKCLLATLIVGGGVTGAIVGTNYGKAETFSVQGDNPNSSLAEAAALTEKAPANDSVKQDSSESINVQSTVEEAASKKDRAEDSGQEELTLLTYGASRDEERGRVNISGKPDLSDRVTKGQEKNELSYGAEGIKGGSLEMKPQAEAIKDPIREEQILGQQAPESDDRAQVVDIEAPSHSPSPEAKAPQSDRDSLPDQAENNSQNNWFSIEEQYLNSIDQEDLYPSECDKNENEGKALIKCPWVLSDPETTISFYFDLSSNPKLSGKKLDNLRELSVTPKTEDTIDLGMVFKDDISNEIKVNLSYMEAFKESL